MGQPARLEKLNYTITNSTLQTWPEARALDATFHQARLVPVSQSSLQAEKEKLPHKVMWNLRMPQPRMLQSLLRLLPDTPRKTSRESQNSAWTRSSRRKQAARNQTLERVRSKPNSRTSTMENPTWSATTSASSVRIILPPPVPLALIEHPLPPSFLVARLVFVGTSTSYSSRPSKIPCPRVSSRPSPKKSWRL